MEMRSRASRPLVSLELESITLDSWPFKVLEIAYGQGKRLQLEVLYSEHDRSPSSTQLRSAWKARTSPAFEDGGTIPSKFTCDGAAQVVPKVLRDVASPRDSGRWCDGSWIRGHASSRRLPVRGAD